MVSSTITRPISSISFFVVSIRGRVSGVSIKMELDYADTDALLAKNEEPYFGDLPPPPHGGQSDSAAGNRVDFKDRPFALAFAANLGVVLFLAVRRSVRERCNAGRC
jgi:hypothetical protein